MEISLFFYDIFLKMNAQHRTLNIEHRMKENIEAQQ